MGSRKLALILAAAAILAACGSHSPGGGPGSGQASKTVAKKPLNPMDQLSRNMVTAVASTKPSAVPLQVKFELRGRPAVGQPVDIDLAIVPISGNVDRVSGKVEGEDGLELVEGGDIDASDRPTEGVPIRHAVKVLPKHEGIFTVRAVLTVNASGAASTESYSMPLIAGNPAQSPEAPAAPSAAPAAPVTAAAQ